MKTAESLPPFYVGHVKNGVVVFDAEVTLTEGQAVRVEPIAPVPKLSEKERAEQLAKMKALFDSWNEEDAKLTDEEADCLRVALEQTPRLSFRTPEID